MGKFSVTDKPAGSGTSSAGNSNSRPLVGAATSRRPSNPVAPDEVAGKPASSGRGAPRNAETSLSALASIAVRSEQEVRHSEQRIESLEKAIKSTNWHIEKHQSFIEGGGGNHGVRYHEEAHAKFVANEAEDQNKLSRSRAYRESGISQAQRDGAEVALAARERSVPPTTVAGVRDSVYAVVSAYQVLIGVDGPELQRVKEAIVPLDRLMASVVKSLGAMSEGKQHEIRKALARELSPLRQSNLDGVSEDQPGKSSLTKLSRKNARFHKFEALGGHAPFPAMVEGLMMLDLATANVVSDADSSKVRFSFQSSGAVLSHASVPAKAGRTGEGKEVVKYPFANSFSPDALTAENIVAARGTSQAKSIRYTQAVGARLTEVVQRIGSLPMPSALPSSLALLTAVDKARESRVLGINFGSDPIRPEIRALMEREFDEALLPLSPAAIEKLAYDAAPQRIRDAIDAQNLEGAPVAIDPVPADDIDAIGLAPPAYR